MPVLGGVGRGAPRRRRAWSPARTGGARLGGARAGLAPAVLPRCGRELGLRRARRARPRRRAARSCDELVRRADDAGIWTIQAGILAGNDASVALHARRCGFRIVGTSRADRDEARRRGATSCCMERRSRARRAQSSSRSASSAAQRGVARACSSCACGSSFRFLPHSGQRPAQSGAAEDLVRQRERDRVARPRRDVEVVARRRTASSAPRPRATRPGTRAP